MRAIVRRDRVRLSEGTHPRWQCVRGTNNRAQPADWVREGMLRDGVDCWRFRESVESKEEAA